MTSTSDSEVIAGLEKALAKAEIEYEAERQKVEAILAECGKTKVQPAKDYWHRLETLRRKVNYLRRITEKPNGRV